MWVGEVVGAGRMHNVDTGRRTKQHMTVHSVPRGVPCCREDTGGMDARPTCFVVSMAAKAHTCVVTVGGIESTHGWGQGTRPTKVKPAKSKIVSV